MTAQSITHYRGMQDRAKARIKPPKALTAAQVAVWKQTVDQLPSDWFAIEQTPVLVAYCCHVARAAQLEVALSTLDPLQDLEQFDKLSKLAGLESAKIAMHARSMRLTVQSRLKAETASTHSRGAASAAAANFDDCELLA